MNKTLKVMGIIGIIVSIFIVIMAQGANTMESLMGNLLIMTAYLFALSIVAIVQGSKIN